VTFADHFRYWLLYYFYFMLFYAFFIFLYYVYDFMTINNKRFRCLYLKNAAYIMHKVTYSGWTSYVSN